MTEGGVAIVRVEGGPVERGRAWGRALAGPIERSLAFYRRFLERRGLGTGDLPGMLASFRSAAERAFPRRVAEIDAVAAGADADPWEVFAVNAFEELEPLLQPAPAGRAERCTAFAVSGLEGTVLAHNELWYAGDAGNVAVAVASPSEGPAFASPSVVTCLPAVGMNAAGVAQSIMSLAAEDDRVGIPRVLVSRHALQATAADDAVTRATVPGRAGGYAHLVAVRGGRTFTVETSATAHAVLDRAAHANHYLDPGLASTGDWSAGSAGRQDRLEVLLKERHPASPEDAMDILRDHGGHPQAICVHADDGEDEASATVFAMVCHLKKRRMWVAAGNPCSAPYEEIAIPEVA